VVSGCACAVWVAAVRDEPRHDHDHRRRPDDDGGEALAALVTAQLADARASVFRAYVRSRDQARTLVEVERRGGEARRAEGRERRRTR
jgi:hypothetical protein